jgi:hypothetical protein
MDETAVKALIQEALTSALIPLIAEIAGHKVRLEMMEEDLRVFAPDRVRNLSAPIWLFYSGDQPVQQDRLAKRRKYF